MQITIRRKLKNWMQMEFQAVSENEQLARITVASFITPLNPTLEEMADVKTAVSEAVTNAIIHGYEGNVHTIILEAELDDKELTVEVVDKGVGIADVEQARQPLFTTGNEERSGMGFTIMESFMDHLKVRSVPGKGTTVTMSRRISRRLK